MARRVSLRLVTRLQDNQDGGYGMHLYNSEEDMLNDHPLARKWSSELKKQVSVGLTQKQREDILNGEDEYENGYIGSETFNLLILDDGSVILEDKEYIHAG